LIEIAIVLSLVNAIVSVEHVSRGGPKHLTYFKIGLR
jgi:hypothetical protein